MSLLPEDSGLWIKSFGSDLWIWVWRIVSGILFGGIATFYKLVRRKIMSHSEASYEFGMKYLPSMSIGSIILISIIGAMLVSSYVSFHKVNLDKSDAETKSNNAEQERDKYEKSNEQILKVLQKSEQNNKDLMAALLHKREEEKPIAEALCNAKSFEFEQTTKKKEENGKPYYEQKVMLKVYNTIRQPSTIRIFANKEIYFKNLGSALVKKGSKYDHKLVSYGNKKYSSVEFITDGPIEKGAIFTISADDDPFDILCVDRTNFRKDLIQP